MRASPRRLVREPVGVFLNCWRSVVLCCLMLCWLAAAAMAGPDTNRNGPPPIRPHSQVVTFYTDPPGATVVETSPVHRMLGVTGQPVTIEFPPDSDDNFRMQFEFSKSGYRTLTLAVARYSLRATDRYPLASMKPLQLEPGLWVLMLRWRRSLLAVAVVFLLGGVAGVRWLLRLRRARRTVAVETLQTVERLNTTMGGYALTARLGMGASVEVYQGMRLAAPGEPDVALKILRSRDDAARRRFQRQIEVMSSLSHPNLVRLIDWGEQGGDLYMVEEMASGGHLRIPPQGMSLDEFRAKFLPLLAAVAYAHGRGVTHRDLKPETVLLSGDGTVKISDFGLARFEADGETTQAGLGTPLYMAPEQLAGQAATAASDQYALGVMGYEMLCGRPPYAAESMGELMKQQTMPPAPLEGVPEDVSHVILRMLGRTPSERFATVETAKVALEAVLAVR
jgi:serine/threonine protein kinase